jgi:outer membrane protein TolC
MRKRLIQVILVIGALPFLGAGVAEETVSEAGGTDRRLQLENAPSIREAMEAIEAYLAQQQADFERTDGDSEAQQLTVRDCVRMALERSPRIAAADSEVDAAEARTGQARSGLRPEINARIGFTETHYNNFGLPAGALGLGGAVGGTTTAQIAQSLILSTIRPDVNDNFTLPESFRTDQIRLTQPLYTGGQVRAGVRGAKLLVETEQWEKAIAVAELEFEVKRSYYDCLLASALVAVSEGSVRTFERNLNDALSMFDVGMVGDFELLRAKTELGARQSELITTQNAERLMLANLRRILVLPQDTPIALAPRLEWLDSLPGSEELVAMAQAGRPEVRAVDAAIAAAEQDVRRVSGQFKPSVAASVDWQNHDDGGKVLPDGWTFLLGADWDLYTGGRRKHEVGEAKAQFEILKSQRVDLVHAIELEVTAATIQLQDAMSKIQRERGTVTLAEEGLRLAELRFREGVGRQTETLESELALTNAQTQLVQALRDFGVANAAMEKALGKSWAVVEVPEDE